MLVFLINGTKIVRAIFKDLKCHQIIIQISKFGFICRNTIDRRKCKKARETIFLLEQSLFWYPVFPSTTVFLSETKIDKCLMNAITWIFKNPMSDNLNDTARIQWNQIRDSGLLRFILSYIHTSIQIRLHIFILAQIAYCGLEMKPKMMSLQL